MPPYLVGDWQTGDTLGRAILESANNPASKCDYKWSSRERLRRKRGAVSITQTR